MKATKERVNEAILFFADKFGQKNNYETLMSTYPGTPKIVEMIVYEMFVKKFNPYSSTDEEYENYKIILEYATELKEKGWVEHQ